MKFHNGNEFGIGMVWLHGQYSDVRGYFHPHLLRFYRFTNTEKYWSNTAATNVILINLSSSHSTCLSKSFSLSLSLLHPLNFWINTITNKHVNYALNYISGKQKQNIKHVQTHKFRPNHGVKSRLIEQNAKQECGCFKSTLHLSVYTKKKIWRLNSVWIKTRESRTKHHEQVASPW